MLSIGGLKSVGLGATPTFSGNVTSGGQFISTSTSPALGSFVSNSQSGFYALYDNNGGWGFASAGGASGAGYAGGSLVWNWSATTFAITSGLTITFGSTCFTGDLRPSFNNTADLGTPALRYRNLYNNNYFRDSKLLISATAPTISSGFGTSPSIVASNGTAAFTINVGTGGAASTGVIGLPAATTGWAVRVMNLSSNTATVFLTKQTATTTTTATIGNYDAAGVAQPWAASDILQVTAIAY